MSAASRPDLAAYAGAIRLEPSLMIKELRDLLGARLVAFLAHVKETRAVHEWAEGERQIRSADVVERLRVAYQAAKLITARDDARVAQAWFQGLNPKLGDRSPARLLRDGDIEEVGPEVLSAARAFAAGGSKQAARPDAKAAIGRPIGGPRLRIPVDRAAVEAFCVRWKITELSFFGSVLTDAFSSDSDVDVLVSFAPDAEWSLMDLVRMEDELARILERDVEMVERSAVESSYNWIRKKSIFDGAEPYFVT